MKILNDLIRYLQKVNSNYPFTYKVSITLVVAGIAMTALSFIDTRTVQGVNTWYKPMKFSWSIAIFLLTIPFFVDSLQLKNAQKTKIIYSLSIIMTLELCLIVLQAARGVPSHYNTQTLFDLWVFNSMGICIALMALLMAGIAVLYFWRPPKGKFMNWQLHLLQFGLLLFLFSCAIGGKMIGNMSHAVCPSPNEYFIPFLGWATHSGDLRISHLFGLHALQVFPFLALCCQKRVGLIIGVGYGILVIYLFIRAMHGLPPF